jgi:hypothetical protein
VVEMKKDTTKITALYDVSALSEPG